MRLRYRRELKALQRYALFIGYPRSGHTLVAALLDAHPDMLFANGLDAALYLRSGFTPEEIAVLCIWNSLRFTRHGRRSNGFDYRVDGGAHGRWRRLTVVGDKSGDLFSDRLKRDPGLADAAVERFDGRARFIHVVRNPYDCISTMARRAGAGLDAAAREFFALCEANRRARAVVPAAAWHDVRIEDLIWRPQCTLGQLCGFLGVGADEGYLRACAKHVFPAPRESRRAAAWSATLVAGVAAQMGEFPWLEGYVF